MKPTDGVQSIKTIAKQKQEFMRKDIRRFRPFSYCIADFTFGIFDIQFCLKFPLFVQLSFKNDPVLFAPLEIAFDVFHPLIENLFRNGHVYQPQTPMYFLKRQLQIVSFRLVFIILGFSTDQFISIETISDIITRQVISLCDDHSRRYQFDICYCFS